MADFRLTRPIRVSLQASTSISGDVVLDAPAVANAFTLSGPTSGTTGSASTFYVTPNGILATTVIVTQAATNAGSIVPLTALTFTAGTSAVQSFTVTRASDGISVVSITNNGGLTNLGGISNNGQISYTSAAAPAAAAQGAYRSTQPNLFADFLATTPSVQGPGSYWLTPARASVAAPAGAYSWATNVGVPGSGPSYTYVENSIKWPWVNLGGDWINTAGVAQATASPHFTFAANSATTGTFQYSVNALAGAQAAWTRGKWNAYILKAVGGSRSIVSQHHASIAGPVMNVTYSDTTTGVLACIACVRLVAGTSYTQIGDDVAPISTSVALEFEMPTKVVTAATIVVTIADHTATASTLSGYLTNPQVNTNPVTTGVAAAYTTDSGIGANAAILFTQRYQDGSVLGDFVSSDRYPLDPSNGTDTLARWDPELFGTGPADTTKLPTAYLGTPIAGSNKWFHKQAYASNVTKVASTYSAENFTPALPGIGALRVVVPASAVADGGSVGYGLSTGCDLVAWFPKASSGLLGDTYVRFMVRIAGSQKLLADTKMFRNATGSTAEYAIRKGKWGVAAQHWTFYGGNAQSGGNNRGHTNRLGFTYHPADLLTHGIETRIHSFDMAPAYADMMIGDIGGLAGSLYPNRWYTIEVRQKLNTYNSTGPIGSSPSDGIMQVWIDGRLASTNTGWKYRDGALDYVNTTPTAAGRLVPFREMGPWGLMLNHYIGGNLAGDEDFVVFYTMIAAGTSYIGPVTADLPTWVPAAGNVAVYTGNGSVLTNNWRSTHDPASVGYAAFYSKKINTDYSASFYIPGWKTRGGMLMWGGGHSATNYNGAHMLTLNDTTMTFECVATPTDWAVADIDRGNNLGEINTYGEVTGSAPLKLGSPHSYGGDGIGSDFVQVYNQAYGYQNIGQAAQAIHRLDLSNSSLPAANRAWERLSNTLGTLTGMAAPTLTRYVPSQNRIYFMQRGTSTMRWVDYATKTYVIGIGTQFAYNIADTVSSDIQTGALVHVPSRNLLLGCYRLGGNLTIQYADTTLAQPSASAAITLSAAIALPANGGGQAVSWCSHSNRLLVFGCTDATRVYEITIPTVLSAPWAVDSHVTNITLTPQIVGTWGKTCDYIESCRCILIPGALVDSGNDSVQVYRPRNT